MTNQDIVLNYLQEGHTIDKDLAVKELGVLNLSSIINILRDDGFNIVSKVLEYVPGKKKAFYWMEKGRF